VLNKRGEDGDPLWILSDQDGSALKRPDDEFTRGLEQRARIAIQKFEPRATEDKETRYWIGATNWDADAC